MAPSFGGWVNQPSWSPPKRILYIDAYDSFSYNVVAMLEETLAVKVTIMTIDSEWPWPGDMVQFLRGYEAVVLGPGPGNPMFPKDVGIMSDIWNLPDGELLPVFGICLGFQSLCLHHGIHIGRLPYPLHGQVRRISSAARDIFEDTREVEVTLYHSLYAKLDDPVGSTVAPGSEDLDFLAWLFIDEEMRPAKTKIPMAVRHKRKPFWGVQFHPESCKSDREACTQLLKTWWAQALKFNKIAGRGSLPHANRSDLLGSQSAAGANMPAESAYSTELEDSITRLIPKAQQSDAFTREKLKEVKCQGHELKDSSWSMSIDRLLQYRDATYVPEGAGIRQEIIKVNHNDAKGHRGLEGTAEAVCSKYHWHDIKSDVEKYMLGCDECHPVASPVEDIALTMLEWSQSTSDKAAHRSLLSKDLTAERICEQLNGPLSPTVLFQTDGRHSIVSVLSPGSWRLEYYAQMEKILLRKLHNEEDDVIDGNMLSVPRFWDALRDLMERKRVSSGNRSVPFWGGFLGYFSYEMGLASLAHPKATEDYLRNYPHKSEDPPDASLLWTERSVVVDNRTGEITIQSIREPDGLQGGWLDQTLQQLEALFEAQTAENGNSGAEVEPLDLILKRSEIKFPSEQSYKKQVEACKSELEAGESYELCLTCETSITLPSPVQPQNRARFPWELYKRLRKYNPAAFSAYARLGNTKIVSSSPECFLTWDRNSTLEMKPMKGTVRKSNDMTMEKAREILSSTKEMAENLMIADLIRHDLYGICGSGGVRVEKLLEVEDHGRVFQMITHVKGEVDRHRPGFAVRGMPQLDTSNMSVYGITALQKCLPPGSMTGAPKERSCMHLQSIEGRKRGIYSGVMGYLDLGGGGSFSVLIRTAFTSSNEENDRQHWRIGAGGAVTTLSTADGEWEEMLTKLRTVCNIFTPLDPGKA